MNYFPICKLRRIRYIIPTVFVFLYLHIYSTQSNFTTLRFKNAHKKFGIPLSYIVVYLILTVILPHDDI